MVPVTAATRQKLDEAIESWSKLEQAGSVARALTGWVVPVVAIAVFAMAAPAVGIDVGQLIRGTVAANPRRELILGTLLAFSALPVLWGISRGLSELGGALPYWRALERFVAAARPAVPLSASFDSRRVELVRVVFRHEKIDGRESAQIEAGLEWNEHESLAVQGENGCGKTTLAWLLLGLLPPDDGQIRVFDQDGVVHPSAAGTISYLAQFNYFDDLETVRAAIRFVAPGASERAMTTLLLGLFGPAFDSSMLEKPVATLSAGQRRIIALARVLLRDSFLTVLDEPEANLDFQARQRALAVLKSEARKRRFLIITHDDQFASLGDRRLTFVDHRLVDLPSLGAPVVYREPASLGDKAS